MITKNTPILLTTALISTLFLAGCGSDSSNKAPAKPTTPTLTKVSTYTSIKNCSTAAEVPNCAFEKGIYILPIGPNITQVQQDAVKLQVENLLKWAHDDVRKQFSKKTIVLGITEKPPEDNTVHGKFVLALATNMNSNSPNLNGIELIYTNISSTDETKSTTTYQKLLQVFDYYVDGDNNTAVGAELTTSYEGFKGIINKEFISGTPALGYLKYDECNYGNGQLIAGKVIKGTDLTKCLDDDGKQVNGKLDPVHTIKKNLNPGAFFGVIYEYKINPTAGKVPSELTDANKPKVFTAVGKIASGETTTANYPFNYANLAFTPMSDYLDKWFFPNKK
ncbi:histidine ammonia-lyase [Vibrio sp. 10N.261.46.E11]|uniref:histidine ammonia-lyase n=1 Tax=Vibrio sp. 10N.261.46.E11 TaxID=3229662 RepID=UPI00354D9B47